VAQGVGPEFKPQYGGRRGSKERKGKQGKEGEVERGGGARGGGEGREGKKERRKKKEGSALDLFTFEVLWSS
jgi:hypothetical protein